MRLRPLISMSASSPFKAILADVGAVNDVSLISYCPDVPVLLVVHTVGEIDIVLMLLGGTAP